MNRIQDIDVTKHAAGWWAEAKDNPFFIYGLTGAGAVVLLDQLTKYIIVRVIELPVIQKIEISGIFDLTYVQNYGASFGLLAGGLASRIILAIISTGVAIALTYWLGKLKRPVAVAGVACIIGGAIGNLYDRLAYGYVVDFLDFSGLMFPWVFNVADAGINVGVGLLLLDAWLTREKKSS